MYDHINRNDLPLNFTSLSPTLRSDFLRLLLLIEHGGLWIDATVKLPENLDWLTRSISKPGTFGFFHHQGYPESWFLYAPEAQDSGLRAWYDSLFKIVHFRIIHIQCKRYCRIFIASYMFIFNYSVI